MVDTFSPPIQPSQNGTGKKIKPRVLMAEFGDGYEQRIGDGLNTIRREVALQFEALTTDQKNTIETNLIDWAGQESFYYTLPDESVQGRYVCSEWSVDPVGPGFWAMTLTLREVFDL